MKNGLAQKATNLLEPPACVGALGVSTCPSTVGAARGLVRNEPHRAGQLSNSQSDLVAKSAATIGTIALFCGVEKEGCCPRRSR